ncbi:protein kinase domain containing protein [Nitzschia inconspicua]|uniref:Protein kinase domain containing protein n=1 Tax=Nitzschia inconspicua TaxID=303405 RepID=A0A9K3P827_9STRA|nr:protein kinase domain containing protein [Nitzschia inconspicua]KAG7367483.1 protein kinase domain containing protein [Nitzschia inconspicua]
MAFLIKKMSSLSRRDSSFDENTTTSIPFVLHPETKRSIRSTYVLKEVIGRGSWGIVRKCQHRETKKCFAVKTINKAQVPAEEREILKQEVNNLERAQGHLHLVQLVDVFEDRKNIHIVTELLTGGELYQQVISMSQRTPPETFSSQDAAWMVRNILDAIRYLHEDCHIAHRDLKASNFLFARPDDPRSIKIIDFGLSRHAAPISTDNGDVQTEESSTMGVLKECVGTVYYVAPEVLTHDTMGYTNKCDIWSVGVIAYLILSASLPFQEADERETVKLLMTQSELLPKFPESKWKNVDPMAIEFCKYLLQKDPANRPSARQAMLHPWLVKYCGKPLFPEDTEKPVRTEKTSELEFDSELCSNPSFDGITVPISVEESWSLRTSKSKV